MTERAGSRSSGVRGLKKPEIKSLYYITHVANIDSILQHGILSHARVEREKIDFVPIYDKAIVSSRGNKITPEKKSLWEYANLYFQPRNPMMYRVINEKEKNNLAVISVRPDILRSSGVYVSDGNAANLPTMIYPADEGMAHIHAQWEIIQNEWWRGDDGSKRKIMSECLVPNWIAPEYIQSVYVANHDTAERIKQHAQIGKIPVIPEPHMFFQPKYALRVGSRISLIEGDMFFSNMHTLTISVNLQGIMGKGLASRAKWQFPDVYVIYQDACRRKKITATRPFLYKREKPMEEELADLTSPLSMPNAVKWFLLFATKRRWQENSRMDDIAAGMDWIRGNYQEAGILSLALPALGCGLGGLDWAEVGPLMCRVLNQLSIQSSIYLPRERPIDPKLLSTDYLLKQ